MIAGADPAFRGFNRSDRVLANDKLLKLGLDVSQRTVARLMPRPPKPLSQSWRTFLQNHLADLVSVDFFVVPTATFRLLYVFVVLLPHRRQVGHFNLTESPTAAWT